MCLLECVGVVRCPDVWSCVWVAGGCVRVRGWIVGAWGMLGGGSVDGCLGGVRFWVCVSGAGLGVGMVCMCGVILMCVGLSGGVFLCLVPFCPVGRIVDTDGHRMLMCVVGGICPARLLGAPYFCDFC